MKDIAIIEKNDEAEIKSKVIKSPIWRNKLRNILNEEVGNK